MKSHPHLFAVFAGLLLAPHLPGQTPPGATHHTVERGPFAGSPSPTAGGFAINGGAIHVAAAGAPGFAPFPVEMEMVTFLGVETSSVIPALAAQLNLQEGTGLLVTHIETGSPAASAFKVHDLLLKFDDQILIAQQQLAVLIRGRKEGDEIVVTYLRGGRSATAKVKLARHEAPKASFGMDEPVMAGRAFGFGPGPGVMGVSTAPAGGSFAISRPEADRLLSLVPRGPGPEAGTQMQIDNRGALGVRADTVNPANSQLTYNDEAGSLELTLRDGKKLLVATDPKGAQVFSGPVTTPEERQAMPTAVRERFEKLEAMQNSVFQTDGRFQGVEAKVLVPPKRSI